MKLLSIICFSFFVCVGIKSTAQDLDVLPMQFRMFYGMGQSNFIVNGSNDWKGFRSRVYSPGVGMEAGVSLAKPLNNKFALSSGLQYNQFSEQIDWSQTRTASTIDPRKGFIDATEEQSQNISNTKYIVGFLELPIGVQFTFFEKGKSKLIANAGLGASFIVRKHIKDPFISNANDQDLDRNSWDFEDNSVSISSNLGISYQLQVKQKYFVEVGPHFNYFLTSFYNESNYQLRPFNAGFRLAVGM